MTSSTLRKTMSSGRIANMLLPLFRTKVKGLNFLQLEENCGVSIAHSTTDYVKPFAVGNRFMSVSGHRGIMAFHILPSVIGEAVTI